MSAQPFEHLHDVLWGKNLHVLTSPPSGDEGELEYVGAAEVNRLKLSGLGFGEPILLFRREYITAYQSQGLGLPANTKPSIVMIGQPGIGVCAFC